MTAFEGGWSVLKASGPPLNALFRYGEDFHEDEYGHQDFRFPRDRQHAMTISAGNFPAFIGGLSPLDEDSFVLGPAKGFLRDPETGKTVMTGRPIGSDINLAPAAAIGRSEQEIIEALASTGRHEAIHQALEPILHEMGASEMRPGGFPSQYDRWTEWGANLAQYHDKDRAAEALRSHPVFRENEYVQGRGLEDLDDEEKLLREAYALLRMNGRMRNDGV